MLPLCLGERNVAIAGRRRGAKRHPRRRPPHVRTLAPGTGYRVDLGCSVRNRQIVSGCGNDAAAARRRDDEDVEHRDSAKLADRNSGVALEPLTAHAWGDKRHSFRGRCGLLKRGRASTTSRIARETSGICTAMTGKSLVCRSGINLFQLDQSAQAPRTSTMVAADSPMTASSVLMLRWQKMGTRINCAASAFLSPTSRPLQKGQQVGVDCLGFRGWHAMREPLLGLQRPVL
jgi:hypothetical protein